MDEACRQPWETEIQRLCSEQEALRAEITELERQRDIFLRQRDGFEAETKRLYADREAMQAEIAEVERQRNVFLQQRDAFEAETKRLYADRADLEAELHEVERQRDVFLQQRNVFEMETSKLYAGHRALVEEINFLKYRSEQTSKLHEQVVMRNWTGDPTYKEWYCSFPFERMEILPRGEVYTCCSAYLKDGYEIGNIFTQEIEDIWNSEKAQKLRYSVTKGSFEYCHDYCMWLSNRKQLDGRGEIHPVKKQEAFMFQYSHYSDCSIEQKPTLISLSCDESCNLQCPSCRSSRRILDKKDSARLYEILMQKIRPLLRTCKRLDMLGSGEIFASTACLRFLKTLTIEEFPNLEILLITNAQLFTRKCWAEFSNLHQFKLLFYVSVDAAEKETYEKIRRGGKWEQLHENMKLISELRQRGIIRELTLNFVVQEDNYLQMPAFVELAGKWGADAVNFQYMTNWGTLSQEEYQRKNVFDSGNLHRQKAAEILQSLMRRHSSVRILQNILDV